MVGMTRPLSGHWPQISMPLALEARSGLYHKRLDRWGCRIIGWRRGSVHRNDRRELLHLGRGHQGWTKVVPKRHTL